MPSQKAVTDVHAVSLTVHAVSLTVPDLDQYPDSAFINSAIMASVFSVTGNATLWKWEQEGRIPKSCRLAGSRLRYWNVGEVKRCILKSYKASKGGQA